LIAAHATKEAPQNELVYWHRCAVLALIVVAPATTSLARFFDGFDNLKLDPTMAVFLKLETHAAMDFRRGGPGYASIFVDGTTDKRGIWWALVDEQCPTIWTSR
jgi:hypothetical protein